MKKKVFFTASILLLALCTVFSQTLNILCEDDPPAQFIGTDGKLTGYTVELVQEIQKRVGNSDPIQMVPWTRGLDTLERNSNVLLFQMTRTADRNPKYQWVGPIAETVFGFYGKADTPIKLNNLEEAKKVGLIGVYSNDVRDQILTKAGFTNLNRTSDNILNIKMLMAGRIALSASSSTAFGAEAIAAGYKPSDIKLVFAFQQSQLYIAMSKDMPASIVNTWNSTLDAMRKDGSFEKIFRKYFPDRPLPGPAITTF